MSRPLDWNSYFLSPVQSIVRLLYIAPINFLTDMFSSAWVSRAKSLSERGWEVAFVTPTSGNREKASDLVNFRIFEIHRTSIPGLGGFSWERSLRLTLGSIIKEFSPDVIISDWNGAGGVSKVAKDYAIPWVFDDHSPPANNDLVGKLQWIHYDRNWRKFSVEADGVVVLTNSLERFIRDRHGHSFEMVKCQSGVDLELFSHYPEKTSSPIKLIYHGSITRERGVLDLIDVVEKLSEEGFDFRLRIFGEGPALPKFKEAAKSSEKYEILGRVRFNEVPDLLSDCHIGLLPWPPSPAFSTSSPIKLFEYAASGLVIVGTNVESNIPFDGNEWFRIADKMNISESMFDAIKKLIIEDRLVPLGGLSRSEAEERFSWKNVTEDLHSLLITLIGSKGKQSRSSN